MRPSERGAARVLLIDDCVADVLLIQRAAELVGVSVEWSHADSAEGGLDLLRLGDDQGVPVRPHLVLLDLRLPGMSGHEFLTELRSDPELGLLPVVVFTSSSTHTDVYRAYLDGANAFVTKPVDLAGFRRVVSGLDGFWFSSVTLPPLDR